MKVQTKVANVGFRRTERRTFGRLPAMLAGVLMAATAAAQAPWIPLPKAWEGKVLPEEPTGDAVVESVSSERFSMAEDDRFAQKVGGTQAAWAAIVRGAAPGMSPGLTGGRSANDTKRLDAPGGLWMKVLGGTFSDANGANLSDWAGSGKPKNFAGDACLYLTGTATVTGTVGGGDYKMADQPKIEGNLAVIIDAEAQAGGLIAGAGEMRHAGFPSLKGDTDVVIRNVQTAPGRVVGSFAWGHHEQSHATHTGNTRILVDIPNGTLSDGEPRFAKELVGGTLVGNGGGECKVVGDTSVTVNAPGVRFDAPICGGGADAGGKGGVTALVDGNTSVVLQDGLFSGRIEAGGGAGRTAVSGTSVLELKGGSFKGAVLATGRTAASVLSIAFRADLRETGAIEAFDRVEIAAPGVVISPERLNAASVYAMKPGSALIVELPETSGGQAYVFPAPVEGTGRVTVRYGETGRPVPLTNNRLLLSGEEVLWTVPRDGSPDVGWVNASNDETAAPSEGVFYMDASALPADAAVTLPAGQFEEVRVLGNADTFFTLRLAPGTTVQTLCLTESARVRYDAGGDADDGAAQLPFTVAGNGIFVKTGNGKAALSAVSGLEAPGEFRVGAGTLLYTDGNTLTGRIRIAGGAVLDCNGVSGTAADTLTLEAGAVLANRLSGGALAPADFRLSQLILEGDASVDAQSRFGITLTETAGAAALLNGRTLAKTGTEPFVLSLTRAENGTLNILEGQLVLQGSEAPELRNMTLRTSESDSLIAAPLGKVRYTGTLTLAPRDRMDLYGRLEGSELLHVVSGTVALHHRDNLRSGKILIDRGAVLDVTDPETEALHGAGGDDLHAPIAGGDRWVTVCGTLRTRNWCYGNGSLGVLEPNWEHVCLDGGTVEFDGSGPYGESPEAAEKIVRGFWISEKGGVLSLPSGTDYFKYQISPAGIDNRGILRLRTHGTEGNARFVLAANIKGNIDVGERVMLLGNATVQHLRFSETAVFDTRSAEFAAKTVTGTLELPLSATVLTDTLPTHEAPLTVLNLKGKEAAVTGSTRRPVTLLVNGFPAEGRYELAVTGTTVSVVPSDAPFLGEISAAMTSGKRSWSEVAAALDGQTADGNTAMVIDFDAIPETDGRRVFSFDNANALTLDSLTVLNGPGTLMLGSGSLELRRLRADGDVMLLRSGIGRLTAAATEVEDGSRLSVADGNALGAASLGADSLLCLGGGDIAFEKAFSGDGAVIGFGLPGDTEVRNVKALWDKVSSQDGIYYFTGPVSIGAVGETAPREGGLFLNGHKTLLITDNLTACYLATGNNGGATTELIQNGGTVSVTGVRRGSDNEKCNVLLGHWYSETLYSLNRGRFTTEGSAVFGWDGGVRLTIGKDAPEEEGDTACFSAYKFCGRTPETKVLVKRTGTLEVGEGGLDFTAGTAKEVTFEGGMLRTNADLLSEKSLAVSNGFRIVGSAVFAAKSGTTQCPNRIVGDDLAVLTLGTPELNGTVDLSAADLSGFAGTFRLTAGSLMLAAGTEGSVKVPENTELILRLTDSQAERGYTAAGIAPEDRARVQFVNSEGAPVASENGASRPVGSGPVFTLPAGESSWSALSSGSELNAGVSVTLIADEASELVIDTVRSQVKNLTVTGSGSLTLKAIPKAQPANRLFVNGQVKAYIPLFSVSNATLADPANTSAGQMPKMYIGEGAEVLYTQSGTGNSGMAELTGPGTFRKVGDTSIFNWAAAYEPKIVLEKGIASMHNGVFKNKFCMDILEGTVLQIGWPGDGNAGGSLDNSDSRITLHGGSELRLRNGWGNGGGDVRATFLIDASDDKPVRITGSQKAANTKVFGSFTGVGQLDFCVPGKVLYDVSGVLADRDSLGKLSVKLSHAWVQLKGENTYSGGTWIAKGVVPTMFGAKAFGTGPIVVDADAAAAVGTEVLRGEAAVLEELDLSRLRGAPAGMIFVLNDTHTAVVLAKDAAPAEPDFRVPEGGTELTPGQNRTLSDALSAAAAEKHITVDTTRPVIVEVTAGGRPAEAAGAAAAAADALDVFANLPVELANEADGTHMRLVYEFCVTRMEMVGTDLRVTAEVRSASEATVFAPGVSVTLCSAEPPSDGGTAPAALLPDSDPVPAAGLKTVTVTVPLGGTPGRLFRAKAAKDTP